MAYVLDLFTPETWRTFRENGAGVTGFRHRYRRVAGDRVNVGDIFICYLTRLSRWCGALRVKSAMYRDDTPIFGDPDPYIVRFEVEPIVMFEPEYAIPITEQDVWNNLSITNQHEIGRGGWTGFFRSPLNNFDVSDGEFLIELLSEQEKNLVLYQLSDKEKRHITGGTQVRSIDRVVEVEVPDDDIDDSLDGTPSSVTSGSESIEMQATVAHIGAQMGFRIWVPRNNKTRVQEYIPVAIHDAFLEDLPLNYDDITLRTIEQIDVLWLKGRSMARAFEIEHTTAIYSGLLRMADLLALQPNMDIRLHIVAPDDRREQVIREIKRPVFSLLERSPLYERCSFLSYSSIASLHDTPHLSHMSDTIISEYEESSEV